MYGHSEYGISPFDPVWQCLSLDSGQRRSCKFDEGVDPADEVFAKVEKHDYLGLIQCTCIQT